MSKEQTLIEVGGVETFRVMPNLRWIERDEIIETDLEGNVITAKTIKVLQQLHYGDRGTELWEDVPTTKH